MRHSQFGVLKLEAESEADREVKLTEEEDRIWSCGGCPCSGSDRVTAKCSYPQRKCRRRKYLQEGRTSQVPRAEDGNKVKGHEAQAAPLEGPDSILLMPSLNVLWHSLLDVNLVSGDEFSDNQLS